MAHFIVNIEGSRGPASRLGTKSSGISSHARGWNAGVRVEGRHDEDAGRDEFAVYSTGGSGGRDSERLIAIVHEGPNGYEVEYPGVAAMVEEMRREFPESGQVLDALADYLGVGR